MIKTNNMDINKVIIPTDKKNINFIKELTKRVLNNTLYYTHKQFNKRIDLLKGCVNMREISIEELESIKVVESSIIEEDIKTALTTTTEGKVKIATIKEIIESIGLDYDDKQVRYKVRYYLRKLKDNKTISLKNRLWYLNN